MRLWVVWVCEHEPLGIQLGDPCVYHVLVAWGSTVKSSRAHTHHTQQLWALDLSRKVDAKECKGRILSVTFCWGKMAVWKQKKRSTTFPNVPQRFRMLQVLIAWDECRERKGWRRTLYRALPRSTRPGNGLRFVPWEGTKKSAKIWRNQGPNFVPIDFPLKQSIKIIKIEFCGVLLLISEVYILLLS